MIIFDMKLFLILFGVVILGVFSVGCVTVNVNKERGVDYFTPINTPVQTQLTHLVTPTVTPTPSPFVQVTHILINIEPCVRTSTEYGNIISLDLRNASNKSIHWSGEILPVDVEVKTRSMGQKTVFKGTGTISSWADRGMRVNIPWGSIILPYDTVPFSKMYLPNDIPLREAYGTTYVTVYMPNGKTYSAISSQVEPLNKITCNALGFS